MATKNGEANGGVFGVEDCRVGPDPHGKAKAHPTLTSENVFGEDDSRVAPECKYPAAPKGDTSKQNYR